MTAGHFPRGVSSNGNEQRLLQFAHILDFVATAKRAAPEAIRAPWQTYSIQIDAQTAVFENYAYDMRAAEEKATADEKKVFEEPSERAQAAFGEILTFEAFTRDAGQPPAADVDVDFSREKPWPLLRGAGGRQGAV